MTATDGTNAVKIMWQPWSENSTHNLIRSLMAGMSFIPKEKRFMPGMSFIPKEKRLVARTGTSSVFLNWFNLGSDFVSSLSFSHSEQGRVPKWVFFRIFSKFSRYRK